MKASSVWGIFIVIGMCLLSGCTKGVLDGVVLNVSGQAMEGVQVKIAGSEVSVKTSAGGKYSLPYVPGKFDVTYSAAGYLPASKHFELADKVDYPVEKVALCPAPPAPGVYFVTRDGLAPLQPSEVVGRGAPGSMFYGVENGTPPNAIMGNDCIIMVAGDYDLQKARLHKAHFVTNENTNVFFGSKRPDKIDLWESGSVVKIDMLKFKDNVAIFKAKSNLDGRYLFEFGGLRGGNAYPASPRANNMVFEFYALQNSHFSTAMGFYSFKYEWNDNIDKKWEKDSPHSVAIGKRGVFGGVASAIIDGSPADSDQNVSVVSKLICENLISESEDLFVVAEFIGEDGISKAKNRCDSSVSVGLDDMHTALIRYRKGDKVPLQRYDPDLKPLFKTFLARYGVFLEGISHDSCKVRDVVLDELMGVYNKFISKKDNIYDIGVDAGLMIYGLNCFGKKEELKIAIAKIKENIQKEDIPIHLNRTSYFTMFTQSSYLAFVLINDMQSAGVIIERLFGENADYRSVESFIAEALMCLDYSMYPTLEQRKHVLAEMKKLLPSPRPRPLQTAQQ